MKTKTNNKSLRVFLALCLMVQFIVPSMVWESKAATSGVLTLKLSSANTSRDFDLYQIFTVVVDDATSPTTYAYTVTEDFKAFFNGKTLDDGTTIDSSTIVTGDDSTLVAYSLLAHQYIEENATAAKKEALTTALENYAATKTATKDNTTHSSDFDYSTSTEIKISTLSLGYYLVQETTGSGDDIFSSVLVNVLNATEEVTQKGSMLTMDKQILHNELGTWGYAGDNQIGDDVHFRIRSQLPTLATVESFATTAGTPASGGTYVYVISDNLEDGKFTFNDTSVEIYAAVDANGNGTGTALTENTHYTLIPNPSAYPSVDFQIAINYAQMRQILGTDFASATELHIFFDAELLQAADIADGNNDNIASLIYSNNSEVATKPTVNETTGEITNVTDPFDDTITETDNGLGEYDDTVYDYTYQVTIYKEDENKNRLSGVEFELEKSTDDGTTWLSVPVSVKNTADAGNEYTIIDTNAASPAIITTPVDGKITIFGLDDYNGTDSGTIYRLKETKGKDGYSLLTDYVEFYYEVTYTAKGNEINSFAAHVKDDAAATYLEVDSSNTPEDYTEGLGIDFISTGVAHAEITIINNSGELLPETGGAGTYLFYAVGIGMMAAAGFLVYSKRKDS